MLTKLLHKADQLPPIPRCEAYRQIGLSRIEGKRLAQILGFGLHEPFTPDQFQRLRDTYNRLVFWRECGLSFERFCKSLEKEQLENG